MGVSLKNFTYKMFIFSLLYSSFCLSQDQDLQEENLSEEAPCLVLNIESSLSRALNDNRQIFSSIDSYIKAEYGITLAESDFEIQISPNPRKRG